MPTKKEPKKKSTAATDVVADVISSKPKAVKTAKSSAAKKAQPLADGPVALSEGGEKNPPVAKQNVAKAPKAPKAPKAKAIKSSKLVDSNSDLNVVTQEDLLSVHVTHEAIELRAYFIGENRRMFGQEGDPKHDWLEAERQLRFEGYSINQALLRKSRD
jgi:hypothetical protein